MSDLRTTTTATASATAQSDGYNQGHAIRSIAISIVVNAVFPFLIYRFLEPRYPAGSIMPLLASTVFPLLALLVGMARRRSDVIAIISLVEITISIVVTLVASDVRLALIARALQGTLTGVFFLVTVMVGRPLLYYVARQFVAAGSPTIVEGFERATALDNRRTFKLLTSLWGFATILVSVANLWLAMHVAPAQYLLVSPILGIGSNVILIALTIRIASRRMMRYRDQVRDQILAEKAR